MLLGLHSCSKMPTDAMYCVAGVQKVTSATTTLPLVELGTTAAYASDDSGCDSMPGIARDPKTVFDTGA